MARTWPRSRLAAWVAVSMVASLLAMLPTQPARSAPTDLLISEYVEGSSFNKAIEIFNGTGAAIDLSSYTLELYSNGVSAPSRSVVLSGTLAAGDVFVMAHGSADQAILDVADETNSDVINFNGDDAVVLRDGGVVVDAFGQIGFDPGSRWGTEPTATVNNTLRRKASIESGDTDGSDPFDPAVEWEGFGEDTFDGLGSFGTPPVVAAVINEFSANHTGTDTVEYVEVFGPASIDLSDLTILEIEGDGSSAGIIDEVITVGATDGVGLWLGELSANSLENGTITLLLVRNFTGAGGEDLDAENDGTLDASPWDEIVDAVAVSDGGSSDSTYTSTVLSANYDGLPFPPGGASRIPDGTDTDSPDDWVRNDFDLAGVPGFTGSPDLGEALNTPGATNQAVEPPPPPPLGVCGDPATLIHDVQGPGADSPVAGATVVIEGIVVGDFQSNGQSDDGDLDGFHVQEEDADADTETLTSEGVFVFAPGAGDVNPGDRIRVLGSVSEFFGLTEITADEMLGCSTGNPAPTPGIVSFPVSSIEDLESFEGMSVTLPQKLTIAEYFNFDRFGEIVLTLGRQVTPTALVEPEDAAALAEQYRLARITVDDGRTTQNPDPAIHPNGNEFTLDNLFRGGDTVSNVTGVMDFAFDLYRIQPTEGADYRAVNDRPVTHEDVGGTLEVASFNVLNYFTTFGAACGPNGDQDCRGADNTEELTRQRAKIVAALSEMSSDVVGLIEIENSPGDGPTADLVSGLNDALGAGTYDYVATRAIGTDAIRQALIYKTGSVIPVGDFAVLDSSVDPRFDDDRSRPVLAQTFVDLSTGGVFTVAVNHLKSKGSDCGGPPDDDPVQGNCNLTRLAAAEAMVDWLATDPTGSGDEDFLIIGDLNAYDKEDPIDAILEGSDDANGGGDDYTDLIRKYQGEEEYSFVFDGQVGYLDHGLAGAGIVDEVTGATIWHINADEADLIDYDTSFKKDAQDAIYAPDPYRSSDHDPVIVGLAVCDEIAPKISVGVSLGVLWPPDHQYQFVTATVVATDNFDRTPTVELVSVTSDEPDNGLDDGDTVDDIVTVDDDTFKLRAERSGVGDGRVYTITYKVTDDCGNSTLDSATVVVPLSMED